MSRCCTMVLVLALLWGCGGERVMQSGERQGGRPLGKVAVEENDATRAVVVATVRRDELPVTGARVEFSRSIAGRAAAYLWFGMTDEAGQARVEIASGDVTGYYLARASLDGREIGTWSSIPINRGYEARLDLPIGGKARVTGSVAMSQAAGKLSIYNWFDYFPQALLDEFSAETGIEATIDTYTSNEEMLASLKAGKLGTYDVAVPSDYMVQIMIREGMLDEIGPGELTNAGNIEARWMAVAYDPGRKYSIPYQWGTTSFAVNRDVYAGDINTTDILFDPPEALRGKINVLDSQAEVLAMASLHLGIPQCTADQEELDALDALLQNANRHWASFGSDTAKDALVSGTAAASMIYSSLSIQARTAGANIEYAYPKEGYIRWMDNVVLLKRAPNSEQAIAFMNFLLEPENIAAVSNDTRSAAGVEGVVDLLDAELIASPEYAPPADAPQGTFVAVCDQKTQAAYDAIWGRLKEKSVKR